MDYENLFNTEGQKEQSQEELTPLNPPVEDKKHTEVMNLLGRLLTEVTSLRSEVASIKAKVCGELYKAKAIMPQTAISTLEELRSFDRTLNNSNIFSKFVNDLYICSEKSYEKFIRKCWRDLLSDDVARQCSWRGTESKLCIRGMLITSAVRAAFMKKFALEDADFDKVTQKYFQYAQDRVTKSVKRPKIDE